METKEELFAEVIAKFADEEMRAALKNDCICWKTPVVGIQDILLETPPLKSERTFTGLGVMKEKEYAQILKYWKEHFIGGSEKLSPDCESKYWYPPEGAGLYRLQRVEHHFEMFNGYGYFLLRFNGRDYFLVQRFGDGDNDLHVIGNGGDEFYLRTALHNVLLWKPKNKKKK
jgi:hypothetical protein